jgi:hypothetical protein
MSLPYKVYNSNDAGAPAVLIPSTTPGVVSTREQLVAILDACLVNGYGSKTSAGWTKPFADVTDKTFYKSQSTTSFGFRVDAPTTNGVYISSLINPTTINDASINSRIKIIHNESYNKGTWTVFANATSCIIWVRNTLSFSSLYDAGKIYFLGEVDNVETASKGWAMAGATDNGYSSTAGGSFYPFLAWANNETYTEIKIITDVSGTYVPYYSGPFSSKSATPGFGIAPGISGKLLVSQLFLADPISYKPKKVFPNFYVLESLGNRNMARDDILTFGEKKYTVCQFSTDATTSSFTPSTSAIFLIEIE